MELVPVMRAQELPSVVYKGIVFSWVSKTPCFEMKQFNMYDMQPFNHNWKGMNKKVFVHMFVQNNTS